MPIKIPNKLPSRAILEAEGVPIIPEKRASLQDIRPLQLLVLNLMPDKIGTETQLLRGFGGTPLQIDITFMHASTHKSKNTSKEHLQEFYKTHEEIIDKKFDGFIMTGAPLGKIEFEDVDYWREIQTILNWADEHVYSSLFICWGSLAALYHYHNIPKRMLSTKKSGVYKHKILNTSNPLVHGFDDFFYVPVSRYTEINPDDIKQHADIEILASAEDNSPCLLADKKNNRVYMSNHIEYDAETLRLEYERDQNSGLNPNIPHNYFPDDDINITPPIFWRAHRNLLFTNWINTVYQGTPFDLYA